MKSRFKTMTAFLVALAFAFCVLAPVEEIAADGHGTDPTLSGQAEGGDGGLADDIKDGPYGDNYVHWFSLAIVALLVLTALAYLHIKSRKK